MATQTTDPSDPTFNVYTGNGEILIGDETDVNFNAKGNFYTFFTDGDLSSAVFSGGSGVYTLGSYCLYNPTKDNPLKTIPLNSAMYIAAGKEWGNVTRNLVSSTTNTIDYIANTPLPITNNQKAQMAYSYAPDTVCISSWSQHQYKSGGSVYSPIISVQKSFGHDISWDLAPVAAIKGKVYQCAPKTETPRWYRRAGIQKVVSKDFGTRYFYVYTDLLSRFYVYPAQVSKSTDNIIRFAGYSDLFMDTSACNIYDFPFAGKGVAEPKVDNFISPPIPIENFISYVGETFGEVSGYNPPDYSFASITMPDPLHGLASGYTHKRPYNPAEYLWEFNYNATKATTIAFEYSDQISINTNGFDVKGWGLANQVGAYFIGEDTYKNIGNTAILESKTGIDADLLINLKERKNYYPVLLEVGINITLTGKNLFDFSTVFSVLNVKKSKETDIYYIASGYTLPTFDTTWKNVVGGNELAHFSIDIYGNTEDFTQGKSFYTLNDYTDKTPDFVGTQDQQTVFNALTFPQEDRVGYINAHIEALKTLPNYETIVNAFDTLLEYRGIPGYGFYRPDGTWEPSFYEGYIENSRYLAVTPVPKYKDILALAVDPMYITTLSVTYSLDLNFYRGFNTYDLLRGESNNEEYQIPPYVINTYPNSIRTVPVVYGPFGRAFSQRLSTVFSQVLRRYITQCSTTQVEKTSFANLSLGGPLLEVYHAAFEYAYYQYNVDHIPPDITFLNFIVAGARSHPKNCRYITYGGLYIKDPTYYEYWSGTGDDISWNNPNGGLVGMPGMFYTVKNLTLGLKKFLIEAFYESKLCPVWGLDAAGMPPDANQGLRKQMAKTWDGALSLFTLWDDATPFLLAFMEDVLARYLANGKITEKIAKNTRSMFYNALSDRDYYTEPLMFVDLNDDAAKDRYWNSTGKHRRDPQTIDSHVFPKYMKVKTTISKDQPITEPSAKLFEIGNANDYGNRQEFRQMRTPDDPLKVVTFKSTPIISTSAKLKNVSSFLKYTVGSSTVFSVQLLKTDYALLIGYARILNNLPKCDVQDAAKLSTVEQYIPPIGKQVNKIIFPFPMETGRDFDGWYNIDSAQYLPPTNTQYINGENVLRDEGWQQQVASFDFMYKYNERSFQLSYGALDIKTGSVLGYIVKSSPNYTGFGLGSVYIKGGVQVIAKGCASTLPLLTGTAISPRFNLSDHIDNVAFFNALASRHQGDDFPMVSHLLPASPLFTSPIDTTKYSVSTLLYDATTLKVTTPQTQGFGVISSYLLSDEKGSTAGYLLPPFNFLTLESENKDRVYIKAKLSYSPALTIDFIRLHNLNYKQGGTEPQWFETNHRDTFFAAFKRYGDYDGYADPKSDKFGGGFSSAGCFYTVKLPYLHRELATNLIKKP